MARNRVSMMLAALLIAGSAEVAFAQATVVNGRIVIPVDAFADFADPDNISVKGVGVRSLGGRLLAQTLKRAVPRPIAGRQAILQTVQMPPRTNKTTNFKASRTSVDMLLLLRPHCSLLPTTIDRSSTEAGNPQLVFRMYRPCLRCNSVRF